MSKRERVARGDVVIHRTAKTTHQTAFQHTCHAHDVGIMAMGGSGGISILAMSASCMIAYFVLYSPVVSGAAVGPIHL